MIFVDTSLWFASAVPEDPNHTEARALLLRASTHLVTTDYVVDELLTLLTVRRQRNVAVRIGSGFWSQETCRLIWTTQSDIAAAWTIYSGYVDKTWSFTDCVSYAVMKRREIKEALSLDEHFKQFGFASVLP